MQKAASLPDRYRIGKTQFYERRQHLIRLGYDMEADKLGRNSYYSDEQIQIFDDLNTHYQKWGTLEGFPSATPEIADNQTETDKNSPVTNTETGLVQRESEKVINNSVDTEEIFVDTNPLEDIQEDNFRRVDEAAQFAAAQNIVAFNYLTVNYMKQRDFSVPGLRSQVEKSSRVVEESLDSLKQSPEVIAKKLIQRTKKEPEQMT
ncbi:MAG: hypothetical protein GPJ14_11180 [Microcystis aeruginosa G11-01]|nr:hypothetical protein [Microcystis aeruginosa LG13-11]NCR66877.1 hypothetical protein [Microcystis aeruginosa LL11-07]NCR89456.1 hypothetical protein [Microcystis aeruginosa G13-10]NCS34817.1 hypothetical protein [Microcystis aeruginosa G11-01]